MNSVRALLVSITLATLALPGCAPLFVGGVATGVTVIHDRRTSATILEDQNIELKILDVRNQNSDISARSRISATSYNMVVLLTGQAETIAIRARYAELVRQVPKVKRVVNEVTIGPAASLTDSSEDYYITTKVKVALFDLDLPDLDPTRTKVVTEQNVVYLMGLVTREEADAIVERVRRVRGVDKVVKVFEYISR